MDTPAPQPVPLSAMRAPTCGVVLPGTPGFWVSARVGGGVVAVTVVGDLDVATTSELRRCAQNALTGGAGGVGVGQLVIECGGLSFIGAAGLGTLVAIQNLAARQGTAVVLTGVTPMMRIVRLEGHFTVADSAGN